MYCQSCGSLIGDELNYCNRCGNRVGAGNRLTTQDGDARISVLKSLSIATGFVGVVSVGGLIGLIAILISSPPSDRTPFFSPFCLRRPSSASAFC